MYGVIVYQDTHFRVEFDSIDRVMYGILNSDIKEWVSENIKSGYYWLERSIFYDIKKGMVIGMLNFNNEEDAMAFKLAW